MVFPELVTTCGDEGYKAVELEVFSRGPRGLVKRFEGNIEALCTGSRR